MFLLFIVLLKIFLGIHGIPRTSVCIHNYTKLVLQKLIFEKIDIFFEFKKTNLSVYEKNYESRGLSVVNCWVCSK